MKNLTKVLSVVVALCMLFSITSFAAVYSDVKADASYAEAVQILSSLNILKGYEDGTFGPDKTITRAEFAAVVIRAKALNDAANGAKGSTKFTDVKGDHWATGYINMAAQQGIVNGMGDGTFAADAPVTFEQAVKMIVVALGYEPMAKTKGGYPTGYLVVAAQEGITKGVGGKAGEPASRATVARMIFNSLSVPMMDQTGYGTDISFQKVGKTLLDGLDVVEVSGQVTAKRFSTSSNGSTLKDDEVQFKITNVYEAQESTNSASANYNQLTLDKSSYSAVANPVKTKVGTTNAKDLLGYEVSAYIANLGDDDTTIIAIAPKAGKNKTVSFTGGDFKLLPTSSTGKFEYWTDKDADKYTNITLADSITYFENGVQQTGTYTKANTYSNLFATFGTEGTLVFLDNDNDDEYEIAFATKYKSTVVDEISKVSYRITGKNNNGKGPADGYLNSVVLDYTNKDYGISFVKDGKAAKFEDIQKGDVLSIAGSINTNNVLENGTVIINSTTVKGKVTEMVEMDSTNTTLAKKVSIGGKTYKTIPVLAKIDSFIEGTFYTNADGKIILSDGKSSALNNLAFVTKIGSNGGLSSSYDVRLLTSKGEWKTLGLASKVEFNGVSGIDPTTLVALIPTVTPTPAAGTSWTDYLPTDTTKVDGNFSIYNVVTYDVNSDNKISKINFRPNLGSVHADNAYWAEDLRGAKLPYKTDTMKFSGKNVYVNANTALFTVDAASWDARFNLAEEKISVLKTDSLLNDTSYALAFAYNKDSDNNASAIIGLKIDSEATDDQSVLVISAKSTVSENGETVTKIEGLQAGAKKAFTLKSADVTPKGKRTTVDALQIGDVVQYTLGIDGKAKSINVIFTSESMVANGKVVPAIVPTIAPPAAFSLDVVTKVNVGTKEIRYVYGYVRYKSGAVTLVPNDSYSRDQAADNIFSVATGAYVTKYNKLNAASSANYVVTSDIGDVESDTIVGSEQDGDFVFARLVDGAIKDMVIIKRNTSTTNN